MISLMPDNVATASKYPDLTWEHTDAPDSSTAKQPKEQFRELFSLTETGQVPGLSKVEEALRALFALGREEQFEDGMETDFSRKLMMLVDEYGDEAIAVIDDLINRDERTNSEVASEALRWLGQMDNPLSHHHRLWLLERSLNHSSARVRDGAALGLAFLDDPNAIPYLERAIEKEPIEELRQDLKQILEQLKDTLRESTA